MYIAIIAFCKCNVHFIRCNMQWKRIHVTSLFFSLFTQDHCCILYSIIGWNCSIGVWSRVEGSRCDPNPNEEFAKPDGESLFGNDGKLTPSITVLGEKSAICKPRGNYGWPQSIYMKPRSTFKPLKLWEALSPGKGFDFPFLLFTVFSFHEKRVISLFSWIKERVCETNFWFGAK